MEEEGCDLCGKTWCMCGRIHEKMLARLRIWKQNKASREHLKENDDDHQRFKGGQKEVQDPLEIDGGHLVCSLWLLIKFYLISFCLKILSYIYIQIAKTSNDFLTRQSESFKINDWSVKQKNTKVLDRCTRAAIFASNLSRFSKKLQILNSKYQIITYQQKKIKR